VHFILFLMYMAASIPGRSLRGRFLRLRALEKRIADEGGALIVSGGQAGPYEVWWMSQDDLADAPDDYPQTLDELNAIVRSELENEFSEWFIDQLKFGRPFLTSIYPGVITDSDLTKARHFRLWGSLIDLDDMNCRLFHTSARFSYPSETGS
jgi:hypothetical protein